MINLDANAVLTRDIPSATLPETEGDEFFHVDLIGCSVRSGGRDLGTVHDVLAYPANDVLDVRPGDGAEPLSLAAAGIAVRA